MTTDRHDLTNRTTGLSDEFWGEQTEWIPREPSAQRGGPRAAIRRWWDALLGGGAVAVRSHGGVDTVLSAGDDPDPVVDRPLAAVRPTRDPTDDIDESIEDEARTHDGAWTVGPGSRRGQRLGVDPLLARLGGLAVIVTLSAPLVVGFTGSGTDAEPTAAMLATISGAPTSQLADATTTIGVEDPAAATTRQSDRPAGSTSGTAQTGSLPTDDRAPEPDAPTSDASTTSASRAAVLDAAATSALTSAPCGAQYELAAGDYWIRIADAVGVSLAELLDVNDASADTVLVPGRSICLPVGADMPAPPTTIAPTSAPAAPTPPSTPATASAPSRPTTVAAAPATTVVPRPAAVPQSEAVAIIRDVWPDELEERALDIAWRESNHRSNVNNYCCYGLFQIHWQAHRSWLSTLGVTSASQLYDPVVNATAAYTLYQRSGGFGPWGS
jgi:LysM repeat protein